MASRYMRVLLMFVLLFTSVQGRGLLLLYRPKDITYDCLSSFKLRFDLSFGMGMSDTITLVFRTIPDVDYECEVDVNTDGHQIVYAVIRYPNGIGYNCETNHRAFHVMQKNECHPVCDLLDDTDLYSNYWMIIKKGRFRFQFRSNSSINTDLGAHLYEVTVTTARKRRKDQRCFSNETECYDYRYDDFYCMTNGIVCDGIKNCGVEDWYDERKSDCEVPIQHLGYPPILAIVSMLICMIMAGSFFLQRCLPQATNFFIFNSSGDNRLILSPVFEGPTVRTFEDSKNSLRRKSVIPVDWSESSDTDSEEGDELKIHELDPSTQSVHAEGTKEKEDTFRRPTSTLRMMSSMIEKRLRSVVGLSQRESILENKPSSVPQQDRKI